MKQLEEIKHRIDQSAKALDRLTKENLTLKRLNTQLQTALDAKNTEAN